MHTWGIDTGGLYYPELLEKTSLRTFDEVSTFIGEHICSHPICVETGTAYGFPIDDPYWNTTSSLVKRICEPLDGKLISIDIEDRSKNIDALFAAGDPERSRVSLLQGDSRLVMKDIDFGKIDLLCLDSGEDPDLLLDEYLAVQDQLAEQHYVLVDDIHNTHSVKYEKIVPLLIHMSYNWMQVPTETGLFVSSLGYPIP